MPVPHSVRVLMLAGLAAGILTACDSGQPLEPAMEPETVELLDFAPPSAEEIELSGALGFAFSEHELLFDMGPSKGRLNGCWANDSGQNFADRFNLPEGGTIEEVSLFTCLPPKTDGASVHLKLGDSAQGPFFYRQNSGVLSWTAVEGGYEVRVKLEQPFSAPAGEDFWIGVHGNGFNLGQLSLVRVDDGRMAQFRWNTFRYFTTAGDQMFQLFGSVGAGDETGPVITAEVSGTRGSGGWYTSDVGVTWTVTDEESEVTVAAGCDAVTIAEDTHGQTLTCEATSDGGTSSESVTVRRDATRPAIEFGGNARTYTVDQAVAISCSAMDATSGIQSSECQEASGDAYTFVIGENLLSAAAADHAGLDASASTAFEVQVTVASLCALTQRWVEKTGLARSLCRQLDKGLYAAYESLLQAQVGKSVAADKAAILIYLLGKL